MVDAGQEEFGRLVLSRAARIFGVSVTDVVSDRRQTELIRCRELIVWSIRRMRPEFSYPAIGRLLSQDHSSVLKAHSRAIDLHREGGDFTIACRRMMAAFGRPGLAR